MEVNGCGDGTVFCTVRGYGRDKHRFGTLVVHAAEERDIMKGTGDGEFDLAWEDVESDVFNMWKSWREMNTEKAIYWNEELKRDMKKLDKYVSKGEYSYDYNPDPDL